MVDPSGEAALPVVAVTTEVGIVLGGAIGGANALLNDEGILGVLSGVTKGFIEGAITGVLSGVGFGGPLRAASFGLKGSGRLGIPTGITGMMVGLSIFATDVFGDNHLSTPKPAK